MVNDGIVNADSADDSTSFPEKWLKKLPTGFADEASGLKEEDLKRIIIECEGNLYTIDKEKSADTKLKAAKEVVKDLGAGYREATVAQNAKIKYCLYLLEGRGIDLDNTDDKV